MNRIILACAAAGAIILTSPNVSGAAPQRVVDVPTVQVAQAPVPDMHAAALRGQCSPNAPDFGYYSIRINNNLLTGPNACGICKEIGERWIKERVHSDYYCWMTAPQPPELIVELWSRR